MDAMVVAPALKLQLTMLNSLLTSSYLQYKSDTDTVASWLASTAIQCGYAADFLTKGKQKQQGSGRLKGKARKVARDAPAKPTLSTPPIKTYTIAIKDFIGLAEYIADYKGTRVEVPKGFASSLHRAIAVRRSHGADVSEALEKTTESQASDDRHSYFIGVLEHVRDILRPLMPESLKNKEPETKSVDAEKLSNVFNKLELFEPSEDFLDAPGPIPSGSGEPPSAALYEAERLHDLEEALLLFQLLVQDMGKIRAVILKTWSGYKMGMFDLVSASVTTNTAVDIARRMEEDAQPIFDKHGGSEKLLQLLHLGYCIECEEDPTYKERPDDFLNLRMYNFAEKAFWPTYILLEGFCAIAKGKKNIPQYKPGHYGTYNPLNDRSKMTDREKSYEDRVLLMEMLSEINFLCKASPRPMSWEDELTSGLRTTLCETGKIPLWLTFAAHLWLDTHHILRNEVSRAYDDLYEAAVRMKDSIKEILDFHRSLKVDNWPRSNDMAFNIVLERIEWVVDEDTLQDAKRRAGRPVGQPFDWLKQHPIYAGLYLYHIKAMFQEIGITFVGAWGSVMYAGHLYNAVRQEKLLNIRWDDMELLFMLHENFFVGGRPRTPDDYLKRFVLSLGASASTFAKNKRNQQIRESKRGPRGLTELAPVARMFHQRYCKTGARTDLAPNDLEEILSKGMWEENEEESAEISAANGQDLRVFARSKQPSKEQRHRRRRFTPPQLLQALRNSLGAEALEFSFDYLKMHKICWTLLRSVERQCRPHLTQMFGPMYIEHENQLPYVVSYVFMAATETDHINAIIAKKENVVTSALLVEAADALGEHIRDGVGTAVSREMRFPYEINVH
ncbi:uncharacterized protein EURHEDRAFT_415694 [Aspergillus ruber CBS 135680]|uniref:DUF6604 domain-containing protein n=1 Tax=Aspergillus ruber (strain CBS 135680) TaxID=1388766 RepID=A0A017S7V9_ASPRC|nr:uncharacterized protein EURHEDRAFT_415694 [Aspergillus ruber CBS 135680]EYE92270.1 hypothetical protein EURHEDRAFT_415694 [Aspergillus ruber CBS 135680]